MFVYKITHTKTGDFYIGSTKYPIQKRFVQHLRLLRIGQHTDKMQAIYSSPDDYTISLLDKSATSSKELLELEQNHIKKLQPTLNIAVDITNPMFNKTSVLKNARSNSQYHINTYIKILYTCVDEELKLFPASIIAELHNVTVAVVEHIRCGDRYKLQLIEALGEETYNHLMDKIKHRYIWKFISPTGEEVEVKDNLTKFCREQGLLQPKMHEVSKGRRYHHKGWRKAD